MDCDIETISLKGWPVTVELECPECHKKIEVITKDWVWAKDDSCDLEVPQKER